MGRTRCTDSVFRPKAGPGCGQPGYFRHTGSYWCLRGEGTGSMLIAQRVSLGPFPFTGDWHRRYDLADKDFRGILALARLNFGARGKKCTRCTSRKAGL
ncbi:hypothetical protein CROQUDRAFT_651613 [Cronartium quercuum f. sp. fusiforme G11]|uniref:Uncharacterized protein n=1 Tax=Cronartium quercuum f. sp. fusiforme G11 TaxID=708437 RepID=A0A9P6TGK1_9BASI|nr:hypothetical protein CROQUDRAFT_651613 [Cronartium quercuum f. sp. fusiforme G11]